MTLRYGLRNAILPVVTLWGLQFGTLIGRAVVVETVFAYPGLGMLAYRAIANRDIPVIQAFVIVAAGFVVVVTLIVDLAYPALDPRVRRVGKERGA